MLNLQIMDFTVFDSKKNNDKQSIFIYIIKIHLNQY